MLDRISNLTDSLMFTLFAAIVISAPLTPFLWELADCALRAWR